MENFMKNPGIYLSTVLFMLMLLNRVVWLNNFGDHFPFGGLIIFIVLCYNLAKFFSTLKEYLKNIRQEK